MSTMIILMCLMATPQAQCNETTAVEVIKPVDRYATPIGCALAAVQAVAPLEGTYPLVRCSR